MTEAKVKYPFYYKVTEEDGTPRLETVFQKEALEFISKNLRDTGVVLTMEKIERGK